MAANTPPSSNSPPPGEVWKRFVRSKPLEENIERLKGLAITDPKKFREDILAIDSAAKVSELIDDITAEHELHAQPHQKHEESSREATPHKKDHKGHHDSVADRALKGTVPAIMAKMRTPQFMEEDPALWDLMKKMDNKWDKENKKPGWRASKEEKIAYEEKWVEHKYGNLDDPASKSSEERAKDMLKRQYESEYKLDENGEFKRDKNGNPIKKSDKQIKKDQEALKRYQDNENKTTEKTGFFRKKEVGVKFDKDESIAHMKRRIEEEAHARTNLLRMQGLKGKELDQSSAAILERIKEKHMRAYIEAHGEKAEHFFNEEYNNKDKHAKEDFERFQRIHKEVIAEKKAQKEAQEKIARDKAMQQGWANRNAAERAELERQKAAMASEATQKIAREQEIQRQWAQKQGGQTRLDPSQQPLPAQPPPFQPVTPTLPPPPAESGEKNHADSHDSEHKESSGDKPKASTSNKFTKAADIVDAIDDPEAAAKRAANALAKRKVINAATRVGNRILGEKRTQQLGNAFGKANKAMKFISDPKAAVQDMIGNKLKDLALNAVKNVASSLLKRAILFNPYFWAAVGIVLLIIFIIVIIVIIINGGGSATQFPEGSIPGLTLRLEGPDAVPNSTDIQYKIIATYTGVADVALSDPLPLEATFVSATGNYQMQTDGSKNTVIWKLKDNTPGPDSSTIGQTKSYTFTLILHPTQDDIYIKNKILATAAGGGSRGGVNLPPNANAGDFESLMRGQGRNTGVLGDENAFVSKVTSAGESRLAGKEALLHQIYQAATARAVNPLVIVSDWGLESGYDTTGRYAAMGCDPRGVLGIGRDFTSQLSCSTKTWDNLMKEYEDKSKNGIPVHLPSEIGNNCNYTDAFLYAAERYGPTCVVNDGNDYFHTNFYKNYKMFLGQ